MGARRHGLIAVRGQSAVLERDLGGPEYSALSRLSPSTRYHYRVVALRAGLIDAVGDDHEFSTAPPPRTLTVRRAGRGAGTITSSPAAINCGSSCTHAFAFGKLVTLYAKPARGSTFGGWSGACSGKRGCQVKMTITRTVTATFKKKQKKHKK